MGVGARRVALDVLRQVQTQPVFSDVALSAALNRAALNPPDRALATELVYGVLRNRTYLDWQLERWSSRPIAEMEQRVADVLRLGAYQLLFLDRVPAYAAVDEAVCLSPKRASRLVNAVLRKIPQGSSGRIDPLGDDRLSAASIRWSHPRWILELWAATFGLETALAMAQANQETPAAVLRINPLRATRDGLLGKLSEFNARPTKFSPWGVITDSLDGPLNHPSFAAGEFVVQSEASQLVGELLGALPGERIFDTCAAPGGKTGLLAALVGSAGQVLAGDVNSRRLKLMQETFGRLGLENIQTMVLDATKKMLLPKKLRVFDRVLVDAPCSALGTLAKNPEKRWRTKPGDLERLAETQAAICLQAAEFVRPGGALLFSVCTLTPPENRGVVDKILSARSDFALDDLRKPFFPMYDAFLQPDGTFLSLPHISGSEGFFAARFVRRVTS